MKSTVAAIMTHRVVAVERTDPLYLIRHTFDRQGFHHVLVVDQGRLQGIISDRDLLHVLERAEIEEDILAHQFMSRDVITVSKDTSIAEAADLLLKNDISALPVVNAEDHIEGIVTWKDLLRYCLQR